MYFIILVNNYCSVAKSFKPIKKVLAPVDDIDGELQNEVTIQKEEKNVNNGNNSFGKEEIKESKDLKEQISNNEFVEPVLLLNRPYNNKPETIYPNYSSKNEENKKPISNLNDNNKIIFHSNDFNSQFSSFDKFMRTAYKKKQEIGIEPDPEIKIVKEKEIQQYPDNDQIFNIIKQSEDPFQLTTDKAKANNFNIDKTKYASNNIINDILTSIDLTDNKSIIAPNKNKHGNFMEYSLISKNISPDNTINLKKTNNFCRFDGYIQDKKMKDKIFSQINELVSTTECTWIPEVRLLRLIKKVMKCLVIRLKEVYMKKSE